MNPSDLREHLGNYRTFKLNVDLIKLLEGLVDAVETPTGAADPSVPEKVWVIHYPGYLHVTFDEDEAFYEVGNGYAERYSGPYRLISA